jgi:putative FmdB family regulatory protein
MPIYEYQCENCRRLTETLLKVGEKGPKKCPHCGGKLTRVISRTSFQLKGGGWYKDLYASSKPGSSGDGEAATGASGESSSETKATKSEDKSAGSSDAKPEAKTESKTGSKADAKPEKAAKSEPTKSPPTKTGKTAPKKTG